MRRAPVQRKKRHVTLCWRNHILVWVSWQVLLLNPFTWCIFMHFCLSVFYKGILFFMFFVFSKMNKMMNENEPMADRLNGSKKQIWLNEMLWYLCSNRTKHKSIPCTIQICQVLCVSVYFSIISPSLAKRHRHMVCGCLADAPNHWLALYLYVTVFTRDSDW